MFQTLLWCLFVPFGSSITSQSSLKAYLSSDVTQHGVMSGSSQGGTLITIEADSLSGNSSEYEVIIGEYPCSILQVSPTWLECMTGSLPEYGNNLSQPIQIIEMGVIYNVPGRFFSYSIALTPKIKSVHPTVSIPFEPIYIYGNHRLSQIGNNFDWSQVQEIKIGVGECFYNVSEQ